MEASPMKRRLASWTLTGAGLLAFAGLYTWLIGESPIFAATMILFSIGLMAIQGLARRKADATDYRRR
jgi:hypothetical protein